MGVAGVTQVALTILNSVWAVPLSMEDLKASVDLLGVIKHTRCLKGTQLEFKHSRGSVSSSDSHCYFM